MCDSPGRRHRYVGGDAVIEMEVFFSPCNQAPARTVVFVRQECPSLRWGKDQTFEINGQPYKTLAEGIWNGLARETGTIHLSAPGKILRPSTIDLAANTSAVQKVSVAEKTQKQLTAPVRNQFVSDAGVPFANRKLTVHMTGMKAYTIWTDSQGFFDAPIGSRITADDDALGYATAFLISAEL